MKTRKLLSLLLAAAMLLALLAGCGGNNSGNAGGAGQAANNASDTNEPAGNDAGGAEEEDTALDPDENYETGDASLDDPRNQDNIGEKELLVVSFGTSYNDSRRLTIGDIEAAMAEAFPDWSVRRAFTSQIIIDHVASR
ncbi:MAG TPA: sirohydrochlorin cobaltochelatase, partial [Candidatus Pelethomonas intestinigallinarum]|nr:sirohydrochlorin cobaltochelatase [Candidatus Pelethomonas intestinigallinarum]